ncbi:hypothetical protein BsWGS_23270 [Bradybaena similaris]
MSDNMRRFHRHGIVLLISKLLLGITLGAQCPYKQKCTCSQVYIMCNELQLTEMPLKMTSENTYFTNAQFERNNISTVSSGSLPANLSQISFIDNPIAAIADDAFDGSTDTLTSLFFSGAHFIRLPDAFLHLNVLNFLTISESFIGDWNYNAMKHIGPVLGTLSLENVDLHSWPSWLQYFSNLTDLSMNGASLSGIPDDGLDSLVSNLKTLTLNNNSFTSIPKAVSKMIALEFLGFDKNKISDVSWLPQNCKLTSLALTDNRLHDSKQLSNVIRPYANNLTGIQLQGNMLTSFPELGTFNLVQELDFRRNKLIDPNSGSLPPDLRQLKLGSNNLPRLPRFMSSLNSITELYVGSNSITELEAIGFPPQTHGAELQNNKLTKITDTSFPENSTITYILLNNNPLVKISDIALKNLPHLVELQVRNTRLTRLPLALSYLQNVDTFDISNTATLVCTCLERGLSKWILSIEERMLKGTCGETTVYYFYNVMSHDCPD